MNTIESIPFELRLALLFVIGTFLGSLANWAVYRLAWNQRLIGPWTKPHPQAPQRVFADRIPIFGWLGLRRESSIHGSTFWIRPLLVELFAGFALAWLYWWETYRLGLYPPGVPRAVPEIWRQVIHLQFLVHTVFLWLMLVATLIDADEKTIPDMITIPGTLFALVIAAVFPYALLPDMPIPVGSGQFWEAMSQEPWTFMTLASPKEMPRFLINLLDITPFVICLGCWWLWCIGLTRRDWYPRHGLCRALKICFARWIRCWSTYVLLLLGLVGTIGIFVVMALTATTPPDYPWPGTDPEVVPPISEYGYAIHLVGLLSALVGMAAAGGLVWVIRVIGAAILKKEAMGFGDVTLMAMIGAFLGWQASIITFFFAPLIAVLVGLTMWFLRRENEIPFGPFLCIAAAVVLLGWSKIWAWAGPRFELGILIPIIIAVCLVLLAVMLGLLQVIKRLWRDRSGH